MATIQCKGVEFLFVLKIYFLLGETLGHTGRYSTYFSSYFPHKEGKDGQKKPGSVIKQYYLESRSETYIIYIFLSIAL